jgi:hypothetical protein
MTRKEKISLKMKKANDKLSQKIFHWTHGKFSYWTTHEIIENSLNNQKFFFCESDGNSIFFAFEKDSEGNYGMCSQDFITNLKKFEEWLAAQTDKASKTLMDLESLDIDG